MTNLKTLNSNRSGQNDLTVQKGLCNLEFCLYLQNENVGLLFLPLYRNTHPHKSITENLINMNGSRKPTLP